MVEVRPRLRNCRRQVEVDRSERLKHAGPHPQHRDILAVVRVTITDHLCVKALLTDLAAFFRQVSEDIRDKMIWPVSSVGDVVYFDAFSASKVEEDGKEFYIVPDSRVYCKVEESE